MITGGREFEGHCGAKLPSFSFPYLYNLWVLDFKGQKGQKDRFSSNVVLQQERFRVHKSPCVKKVAKL